MECLGEVERSRLVEIRQDLAHERIHEAFVLYYIDCFKQLPHDHSHLDMGKLLRRSLSIHVRASLLVILATRFGDLLACSSSHRSKPLERHSTLVGS